jgi:hypothetical protein
MHEGIAGRVFGSIGPAASPIRTAHDVVARGAYAAVAAGLAGAARLGFGTLGALRDESVSIHDTRRGRLALGALNGAFGDLLAEQRNALSLPMAIRCDGADVQPTAEGLARAYPDASPRIAVLANGLCEIEEAWHIGAQRSRPDAHRLREELGYTPLYLRYNRGRHISENGRELADLLDQVDAAWPVEIRLSRRLPGPRVPLGTRIRRPARPAPQRLGPQRPGGTDALPDRQPPSRGRREPLRSPQPPGRLRATETLAGEQRMLEAGAGV